MHKQYILCKYASFSQGRSSSYKILSKMKTIQIQNVVLPQVHYALTNDIYVLYKTLNLIRNITFMVWSAGAQCGGTGETGQHDDWDGWHRE